MSVFGTTWSTSPREFDVIRERDVRIPARRGYELDCQVFRPAGEGPFPVILGLAPYPIDDQAANHMPVPMRYPNAHMEAGDPYFYARRGYVHVIGNLPGTGASGGEFDHMGPEAIDAVEDAIAWAAAQGWSDGRVGMFGMSYYGMVQVLVAMRQPPALKAIFCPFSVTDQFRDTYYKGGIFGYAFLKGWSVALRRARVKPMMAEAIGRQNFLALVEEAKADPENQLVPTIMEVLENIDDPVNEFLAEFIVNPTYGPHYAPRNVDYAQGCTVPGYFGACWGIYGLHLNAAFRSYVRWNGDRRVTIGPPAYLDRPITQYQDESLRWFDHHLKGIDTGLAAQPPVQVFIDDANEWRSGHDWPLPETRFTSFFLHGDGLLYEHEPWPDSAPDQIADAPEERGTAVYTTPPFRDDVELCGPMVLNAWISTTGTEALVYASIYKVDAAGEERLLTRGWLRASMRALDADRSTPWWPVHTMVGREPLEPGVAYPLSIDIRPYGIRFESGTSLRLKIRTTDQGDPNPDILSNHAVGLLAGAESNVVSIHHDPRHPSHLILPITRGNLINSFRSGGRLEPLENAWTGGGH